MAHWCPPHHSALDLPANSVSSQPCKSSQGKACRVKFDAQSARFVTPASFVCFFSCRKGHSLHVLSLLRQQHCNLSFPCACVRACVRACVCVCVCVVHYFVRGSACAPANVLWCIVLCFIITASISVKLKFCFAFSRLRSYCCLQLCGSVNMTINIETE